MNTIVYVCSAKLALKTKLTKQMNRNLELIVFKDYFNNLPTDEDRNAIRDLFIIKYKMGYTTFYGKLRYNTFTVLEFEKLEEITKQKFAR